MNERNSKVFDFEKLLWMIRSSAFAFALFFTSNNKNLHTITYTHMLDTSKQMKFAHLLKHFLCNLLTADCFFLSLSLFFVVHFYCEFFNYNQTHCMYPFRNTNARMCMRSAHTSARIVIIIVVVAFVAVVVTENGFARESS